MRLFIDTSNNLQTVISLDSQTFITNYQSPRQQNVMGALVSALNQTHQTIQQVTSIEINPGPGSFTGIRVGLSIANALSLALNVPINNQPPGTPIQAIYGKPASITPSKKT